MVLRWLGLLDFVAGVVLVLLKFNLGKSVAWFFVFYLLIKSLIFIKNIASVLDLISVFFYVLAIYNVYITLTWLCVVWLLQKGFFSFFSLD